MRRLVEDIATAKVSISLAVSTSYGTRLVDVNPLTSIFYASLQLD